MATQVGKSPLAYPWVVAILLTCSNILSLVDRKIPLILIEHIKRDLDVSDTEIGLVTGLIFTAVYALFMLPIARLADARSRKAVICVSIAFWSLMTALGGLAQNFLQFATTRIGLAIGEAGCTPPSHSLIADYFPPARRATALGLYMAGGPLGVMLGLGAGGWLADTFDWRMALMLVGAIGLLLSTLILVVVREPARAPRASSAEQVSILVTTRTLWQYRSFRYLALGSIAFAISTTSTQGFSPAHLMRVFDYSATSAGLAIGLVAGFSGAMGSILGGILSAWLVRYDWRWSMWAPAIGLLVAAPVSALAFRAEDPLWCIGLLILPQLAATLFLGPGIAMVQNLTSTRMRAMGSAVLMLFLQGVGASLGPFLAGAVSDLLAPSYGSASMGVGLTFMSAGYAVAALLLFLSARSMRGDIDLAAARHAGTAD